MHEPAPSSWIIGMVCLAIVVAVTFGANIGIGLAAGLFSYIALTILDSIDSNLAYLAEAEEDKQLQKKIEEYESNNAKTDVTA